jgi:hypothetical protein
MNWSEIRTIYPDQWLIIEALEAYTSLDHKRHLERLTVIERCADGNAAMASYRRLHLEYPQREFYFVHTRRTELDIREQQWLGIRGKYATSIKE